jgi:hypothetical protein
VGDAVDERDASGAIGKPRARTLTACACLLIPHDTEMLCLASLSVSCAVAALFAGKEREREKSERELGERERRDSDVRERGIEPRPAREQGRETARRDLCRRALAS